MIKKVTNSGIIPVKMWLDDIEDGALKQAENLSNLPFAFKHIAIMPDSHQGYGMPIGGVLAIKNAIIPNAVGVDIGCGMCCLRTNLTDIDLPDLKKIVGHVRELVPVGFNHHKEQQDVQDMPSVADIDNFKVINDNYDKALYQVGTLGGGNHFIEIQKGSNGFIWIMIHSGSRNLGYTVANHYDKLAQSLCKKWCSVVPKDLAFLPIGTQECTDYLNEMNYCIEFALSNRKLMMERVKESFKSVLDVSFHDFINKPHNFAAWESHFGTNVIVHRKGATRAREGELGMIPGSQGTSSYIVKGLGNKDSFESCSHGAGRKMSRTKARNELCIKAESKALDDLNILHAIRGKGDLDEAPGAYKDIDVVMENQSDLVEIEIKLKPLAVVKG